MFALLFESPERLWWSFALQIPLVLHLLKSCLLYTSPSPRDVEESRMPSSA